MPLTAKGKTILEAFREQYGDRAESIFYAAKNAGTISGVDAAARADADKQITTAKYKELQNNGWEAQHDPYGPYNVVEMKNRQGRTQRFEITDWKSRKDAIDPFSAMTIYSSADDLQRIIRQATELKNKEPDARVREYYEDGIEAAVDLLKAVARGDADRKARDNASRRRDSDSRSDSMDDLAFAIAQANGAARRLEARQDAKVPGQRVKILGGMKEFIGQTGEIMYKEGNMYRVRLDRPVNIPGIGLVTNDLWEGRLLREI